MERRQQREEVLAGVIAAQVGNFSMGAPKTPFRPEDFVWTNPPRKEPKQQTAANMLSIFDQTARLVATAK